jgi:plastocyanin
MMPILSGRLARRRVSRHATLLLLSCLTGAIVLSPTTADAKAKPHKPHTHKHKSHRAKKPKPKQHTAATATPTTPSPPAPCTATPATPGAIDGALTAFFAHFDSAHLSTSPEGQANAALSNPDNYVLIHTVLVQAMLQPTFTSTSEMGSTMEAVEAPFIQHMYSAHLNQSPQQQAAAALGNPDNYVLLHTVMAENMMTPLVAWVQQLLAGTPGEACPPPVGAPAPPPSSGTPGGSNSTAQSVMIMNYAFTPGSLTVSAGTKVTWTNMDSVAHTVTSSGSGPLSSPNIPPQGTWSYTFATPGTYKYYCAIHPNMTGTVTVQ